ncbi:hypothetical protein MKW98_009627 [Papaver atlanticum]|uniref:acylphosphatase n=1 Tax=Papaver atlanticum TaxID=357466 RepID=A0AAD4XD60_9MAGN|nr:hypothetical protein MKW98_009627 [Papaver atlanticum]
MANTIIPRFNHILKRIPIFSSYSSLIRSFPPLTFTPIKTSSSPFTLLSASMSSDSDPTNGESPVNPPPISTKTVRVVVKGRVQGVFYRNWTIENAKELGLTGWVRNRRDGSVEALFSGDPNSVSNMEERCRRGPRDALVTSLQVFPSADEPGDTFVRFPTL